MDIDTSTRYYTIEEIAEMWAISKDTVRRLFVNEPGVLVIGKPFSKYRRSYRTLRIPHSVLIRVHARLTNRAAQAAPMTGRASPSKGHSPRTFPACPPA
jgi:hypothetical protein